MLHILNTNVLDRKENQGAKGPGLPVKIHDTGGSERGSYKRQATSSGRYKQQATGTGSYKQQATSYRFVRYKPQATSSKEQASLHLNPSLSRAKILVPGNNLQEPWLGFLACFTSMNVLCGCFTWNAIWCGENRILLSDVIFSSTVKKWELTL